MLPCQCRWGQGLGGGPSHWRARQAGDGRASGEQHDPAGGQAARQALSGCPPLPTTLGTAAGLMLQTSAQGFRWLGRLPLWGPLP